MMPLEFRVLAKSVKKHELEKNYSKLLKEHNRQNIMTLTNIAKISEIPGIFNMIGKI